MKTPTFFRKSQLAIFLILFLVSTVSNAQKVSLAHPDSVRVTSLEEAAVAALHRDWILVGWERKAGDGQLDFRKKLGKYYNWNADDIILYDDFDPKRRVVRSAHDYGKIWEPLFSALSTARHRVLEGPFVIVSGDLAASTLEFAARLETRDGKVTGIRTFTSFVWRLTNEGWKIVREHNSSTVIPNDQIDVFMKQP